MYNKKLQTQQMLCLKKDKNLKKCIWHYKKNMNRQ